MVKASGKAELTCCPHQQCSQFPKSLMYYGKKRGLFRDVIKPKMKMTARCCHAETVEQFPVHPPSPLAAL